MIYIKQEEQFDEEINWLQSISMGTWEGREWGLKQGGRVRREGCLERGGGSGFKSVGGNYSLLFRTGFVFSILHFLQRRNKNVFAKWVEYGFEHCVNIQHVPLYSVCKYGKLQEEGW